MSVVDLHPDDLLDRDACDSLSPAEGERLERHLEKCSTCRMERQIRADFRREAEPLHAEIDVPRLLSEALYLGRDVRPRPRRHRPPSRWRWSTLLVAAVLFVAGVAAGTWRQISAVPTDAFVTLPSYARPFSSRARATNGTGPTRLVAVAAPPAMTVLMLPSEPAPVLPSPPVAVMPAASKIASHRKTSDSSVRSSLPDAAELFARANDARRAGERADAAELYRVLVRSFPGSPEARESRAVMGRMLLDDGDANAALRSFDDYLRAAGVLREDVMVDRALALARLGRWREEANEWTSLLRAYPSSVHAERARERLLQLGNLCGPVGECEQGRP
jgi:hypothetical protein